MKKLLYLLCFLPFVGFGQTYCPIVKFGDTATLDSFLATIKARQLILPSSFKTNCHNATNSIALVGGAIWTFNGSIWVQQTGGGFDSTHIYAALADTAARLNDRIDSVAALAAPLDTTHIYAAIADSVALRELLSNKVTSFASPNNTTYPTTSAVNTLVASYLLKSDTSTMLAPYVRVNRFTDSINTLRLLSNAKVNYTDTGNMLLKYLRTPDTTGNSGRVMTYSGTSGIYWGALSVVGSLQSANHSLYISPTTGDVNAQIDTAHSNTWIVPQDFTKITIDTLQAHTSAGGAIRTNSGAAAISWGAGGGQNVTFAGYPIINSGDSVLTTNSSGGLLRYDLKGNYKRIADSTGGSGYVQRSTAQKTADSLAALIAARGTVTQVNSGYGIVTTTITTTGTISVDTGAMATRLRVQKGVDSLNVVSATKVAFSDTSFTIGTKAWRQKGIDSINNTAVFPSTTQTLTNKRITFRVTGGSSFTTSVAINADVTDVWEDSLQSGALLFAAPTGTPTNHQLLEIVIKDNATARALTWNTIFSASTDLALPTTTTLSKWLYMLFQYNSRSGKWYLLSKLDNFTP